MTTTEDRSRGVSGFKKIEFGGRMEVKRFYSEVFGVWNGNKF